MIKKRYEKYLNKKEGKWVLEEEGCGTPQSTNTTNMKERKRKQKKEKTITLHQI